MFKIFTFRAKNNLKFYFIFEKNFFARIIKLTFVFKFESIIDFSLFLVDKWHRPKRSDLLASSVCFIHVH